MQDYSIDLFEQVNSKRSWVGLKADAKFKEVLQIRQMELPSGKESAKEKKRVQEMKDAYKLKGILEF